MRNDDSPLHGRSDAELVKACRSGRTEAFEVLVHRYQDRLVNVAYRLTGSRDDAVEAAQEAFLKAYRALDSFRGESAFYTWLFRIVMNEVRSRQRFRAVRPVEVSLDSRRNSGEEDAPALAQRLKSSAPDPADEASRAEERRMVESGLARLDPDEREIIVMRDIEGRDYGEIAEMLDCPRGTVKSRLHRARMALKELLAPAFGPAFGEEKA